MDYWTKMAVPGEKDWDVFSAGRDFFAVIIPFSDGGKCVAFIQTRQISHYDGPDGKQDVTEDTYLEIKRNFFSVAAAKVWVEKQFQTKIKETISAQ